MSNMNEELCVQRITEGTNNAASSAAMFMGMNALFCKPMDSFLPIIASRILHSAGYNSNTDVKSGEKLQTAFVQLLVLPPLLLGVIQLFSWKNYTLHGKYLDDVQQQARLYREDQCILLESNSVDKHIE